MYELPGGDDTSLHVTKEYAEEKLSKSTIKKLKAVS
jgi:ATP-dependent Clp protease ATP-binding subunit ClpX